MSNAAGCHKTVEHGHALRHQFCASRRVGAIVHFTGVRIAILTRERFRLVGVGQTQVQPLLPSQRLDGMDELAVSQFVQTQMAVTTCRPATFIQQGQQTLVQHFARQRCAHGAARFGDLAPQRFSTIGVDATLDQQAQLAGDGLRRNQANVEICLQIAIVAGDVYGFCQQFDGWMRR